MGQSPPHYGRKGQSQPEKADSQRPRCGVLKSRHTEASAPEASRGGRGGSPIPPSFSHGAASFICSYTESLCILTLGENVLLLKKFERCGSCSALGLWALTAHEEHWDTWGAKAQARLAFSQHVGARP